MTKRQLIEHLMSGKKMTHHTLVGYVFYDEMFDNPFMVRNTYTFDLKEMCGALWMLDGWEEYFEKKNRIIVKIDDNKIVDTMPFDERTWKDIVDDVGGGHKYSDTYVKSTVSYQILSL